MKSFQFAILLAALSATAHASSATWDCGLPKDIVYMTQTVNVTAVTNATQYATVSWPPANITGAYITNIEVRDNVANGKGAAPNLALNSFIGIGYSYAQVTLESQKGGPIHSVVVFWGKNTLSTS